jgi:hypothetical protein
VPVAHSGRKDAMRCAPTDRALIGTSASSDGPTTAALRQGSSRREGCSWPLRQFERATSGCLQVPLIGQLSNRQFHAEMERLVDVLDADVPVQVRAAAICRCGCGREVAASRKFVSQAHYNVWLSRERFVGRHLRR